jgi:RNase P subunit RPR2
MNINDGIKNLPGMVCPRCQTVLSHGAVIQNDKPMHRKNDLIVCSVCAVVSRVDDGAEIERLDKQSQVMLMASIASIMKKQQGQKEIVSPNGVRG